MSLILSKKALKFQLIMSFKILTNNISKFLQILNLKNYSLNISCDYEKNNPTKIAIKIAIKNCKITIIPITSYDDSYWKKLLLVIKIQAKILIFHKTYYI